jgi:hypothetical protein
MLTCDKVAAEVVQERNTLCGGVLWDVNTLACYDMFAGVPHKNLF